LASCSIGPLGVKGRLSLYVPVCSKANALLQMPIPDFDRNGLLPAGVIDCTLDDIRIRFGWNGQRIALFNSMADFINNELRLRFPDPWYCDGSFVTDKDMPGDTDVVLDLRGAPDDRKWRGLDFMTREQPRIFSQYRVDFWIDLPGGNEFSVFFQYIGIKTAKFKGLDPRHHKGILRVR
jgi:Family of unknown function (DUF6932)